MEPDELIYLLDHIMTNGKGDFNYGIASGRLIMMRMVNHISEDEYNDLMDACNVRNDTGSYEDSAIYKNIIGQNEAGELR